MGRLVALLLLASRASAADDVGVRLEVATLAAVPGLAIAAETQWLGEARRVALVDDGAAPGDVAGDGVYVAELRGAPIRALPVRLVVTTDAAAEQEAYAGLEPVDAAGDRLAWALELGARPTARRVVAPLPLASASAADLNYLGALVGWAAFALLYVAILVRRALPADDR